MDQVSDEGQLPALACRSELALPVDLGDEYRYAHLSLCVLDAVFSIGVRYEGTAAVVRRYAEWANIGLSRQHTELPPIDEQQPIGEFIDHMEERSPERFAAEVVRNRQRTSSRGGILKAEAALRFARTLDTAGIRFLQDVTSAAQDEKLDSVLRAIPGQGSGISVGYFFMLAGDDNLVKPDRMIVRYVGKAVGRTVSVHEAADAVLAACQLLKTDFAALTPRSLDHAIWSYQRQQRKARAVGRPDET
jgi:hypothetical protein